MASNLATARLLARLGNTIRTREIADDVFTCDPTQVQAIRVALADQPQIGYFLDRGVVADQVAINNLGDSAWALRRDTAPVCIKLTTCRNAEIVVTDLPADQAGDHFGTVTVEGAMNVECHTPLWKGVKTGAPTIFRRGAPFLRLRQQKLGPYLVGGTVTAKNKVYSDFPYAYEAGQLSTDRANGYTMTMTMTVTDAEISRTAVNDSLSLKSQPVLAGPAVCEYAELFPGMQWIVGTFAKVAERLEAVVNHAKTKDASLDVSKFAAAVANMKKEGAACVLIFKGSVDFDPIRLWSLARSIVGGSMADVPTDGIVVTTASKAAGIASWRSNKWCLTVAGGSTAEKSLQDALAVDTAPVTVKASGFKTAHISDGTGTIDVSFEGAASLITGFRSSGRIVNLLDSYFTTDPLFDQIAWQVVLTALAADATNLDGGSVGPAGDAGGLGEAMCARLLAEPAFSPDEEIMVIPCLSPQYFWSSYAREPATTV